MEKTDFEQALQAAGFAALVEKVDQLVRPSIRLATTPVDESALPVGVSKIGGLPDLPATQTWPQWKGLPQSFVAQLRLSDLHASDTQHLLPPRGMLWFFYDAQQETYGDQTGDAGGWSVLFTGDEAAPLQRTPAPDTLPTSARFHACSIVASTVLTLVQQPQLELPSLNWTDAEQARYDKVYATFRDSAAPLHRLLGNPDTLQDDMRMQCQLLTHGVTDPDDPRAKALAQGMRDWLLLLQIDTDERIGMRWASTGMLYYWISQDDLRAAHFARTWLVLQSE